MALRLDNLDGDLKMAVLRQFLLGGTQGTAVNRSPVISDDPQMNAILSQMFRKKAEGPTASLETGQDGSLSLTGVGVPSEIEHSNSGLGDRTMYFAATS